MLHNDSAGLQFDHFLPPTPPSIVGGRYRIEELVGTGGMARVYRARDLKHERTVAVKIMRRELSDSIAAQRFLREITIAANLTHPHILPLHDSGEIDGLLYYVMPFVEGETLRSRLRTRGTIPLGEGVDILRDVAEGLAAAHAQGVVHRDIKPENIMLLGRSAVVADFGVAKALTAAGEVAGMLTTTGVSAGTPAYMAPEQVAADPRIDQRADLYALGVVAYEMFCGAAPFAGRAPTQLAAAILTEEPSSLATLRPDLPLALTDLVKRLLAKLPVSRPANADEVVETLATLAIKLEAHTTQQRDLRYAPRSRRAIVAGGIILIVATVAYAVTSLSAMRANGAAARLEAIWAGGSEKSVAVLPFANTSGDTANEYFSDGLTRQLISGLAKIRGLRVTSPTSVFALKRSALTIPAIADTLHVATIVEGGVHRDGNRIIVTAQLVRAKDQSVLWSQDYDEPAGDIIAIQNRIADAVVRSLQVDAARADTSALVGIPTRDPEAYDLFLLGLYHAPLLQKDRLDLAVAELTEATRRDPDFAPAYAVLADVYARRSAYEFMPRKEALSKGLDAAERAIGIDPGLAAAYASKGFILLQQRRLSEAEKAIRHAIDLEPGYVWGHHYQSLLLSMQGRFREALSATERAMRLDPIAPAVNSQRGILLTYLGDLAGARRALETGIKRNSDQLALSSLATVQVAEGHFEEALETLNTAYQMAPRFPGIRALLAYTYMRLGRPVDANAMSSLGWDGDDLVERARAEALLGNLDRAYSYLDRVSRNDPMAINSIPVVIGLRGNPMLAAFRADSRFPAFLKSIGIDP